jgi:hypothetical protein
VAIPPETALDVVAPHRPEPGNDVLDRAREEMPVVRRPRRKGWAVVKDEGGLTLAPAIALAEGVEALPQREDLALEPRKVRVRFDTPEDRLLRHAHVDPSRPFSSDLV